jgi:hypothetical protein
LGTSENHLGPSLVYMLDAQKLPSQTLEALLAFWQQHASAHYRAGASRHLTIGPAVDFEWCTVTASRVAQYDSALMVVPCGMNSARRTFCVFKKRITDSTSQSAGLSIFLFILNSH